MTGSKKKSAFLKTKEFPCLTWKKYHFKKRKKKYIVDK